MPTKTRNPFVVCDLLEWRACLCWMWTSSENVSSDEENMRTCHSERRRTKSRARANIWRSRFPDFQISIQISTFSRFQHTKFQISRFQPKFQRFPDFNIRSSRSRFPDFECTRQATTSPWAAKKNSKHPYSVWIRQGHQSTPIVRCEIFVRFYSSFCEKQFCIASFPSQTKWLPFVRLMVE